MWPSVIELWTGIPAAKVQRDASMQSWRIWRSALNSEHHRPATRPCTWWPRAVKRSRADICGAPPPGQLHLCGPHGRGQDRACKAACAAAVRHGRPAHPPGYVGVYGKARCVSRLIGSPPGYVGYDEAGQLTEKVRRQPVQRGAVRRDRKGPPGRDEHSAADPGRGQASTTRRAAR